MGEIDEDRAPHHGCDATAEALQKSPGHEHPDVGSEDADERSQGAQHATDDHRNPASLLIGDGAARDLPQSHADEEGRERQTHCGRAGGEIGSHLGEGRAVHVGGEGRYRVLHGECGDESSRDSGLGVSPTGS